VPDIPCDDPIDELRQTRSTNWKWGAFVTFWAVSIMAGAHWLKVSAPERASPLLAALSASEPVHVVAHLILYGTLAAACTRLLRGRVLAILLTVAVGVAQEKIQLLAAGRGMSTPELFDLAVDALAATVAATICARAIPKQP